jgi:hypothetical protein
MKNFKLLMICTLLIPIIGISQSVKSVVVVPDQEIEIVSGTPKYFKNASSYYVWFDYTDLEIGGYENEAAYIAYMREDAELRRKSADDWEQKWFADRETVFEPKFLELFTKHAGSKMIIDPNNKDQEFAIKLHTQFIEIGFNRNFKESPTYINVIVTITDINGAGEPLIISMKYIIGKEAMSSYSADFRRIEEAYAKCGKELAKYMRKVIY